jgi:hypothetical protein
MKKLIVILTLLTVASFNASAQCALSNLDAWSGTTNPDAGALAVTSQSAFNVGGCGLEVAITGTRAKNFVQDTTPNGEQRYRARFRINPAGAAYPTSGNNRKNKFHIAQCVAATPDCQSNGIVQFKLANQATEGYVLDGFVAGDTTASDQVRRFRVDIPDTGWTTIQYDVDLTAGTFKLWMNATAEADPFATDIRGGASDPINFSGLVFTGIDGQVGWDGGISRARIGFMNTPANVPADAPIYIDEFESRRQTFIVD